MQVRCSLLGKKLHAFGTLLLSRSIQKRGDSSLPDSGFAMQVFSAGIAKSLCKNWLYRVLPKVNIHQARPGLVTQRYFNYKSFGREILGRHKRLQRVV